MTTQEASLSSEEQTAHQIQKLLKPIPDDRADAARLDELRRVFGQLYQEGELGPGGAFSATEQTWKTFLTTSHAKFRTQLSQRIAVQGQRTAVRTFWGVVASSPKSCLVGNQQPPKKTAAVVKRHGLLDESILLQWVQAMSRIPIWDKSIQHMVQVEFLEPFRDVQYYTMMNIGKVAESLYKKQQQQQQQESDQGQDESIAAQAERLMQMLMMIPMASTQQDLDNPQSYLFAPPKDQQEGPMDDSDDNDSSDGGESSDDEDDDDAPNDDSDDDNESPNKAQKQKPAEPHLFPMQQLSRHRRQWSNAWLAILRLSSLPQSSLKRALQFLPQKVLPVVSRPLLFADFFMTAYTSHNDETDSSSNSVVPLLALDGLFYLMTQHGLEYPQYYKQLYKIIRPIVFSVKFKTRFFQLLDKSISRNDLLPAHIVAAFCKRLLQCCLQGAPPAGILLALVLVSNWCRQHSEIMCLLHRGTSGTNNNKIDDKFNPTTDDPSQANALQSSLWELSALKNHYYPAVATLAISVGTPEEAKLPLHSLEDYLQLSYKTLLEQERKRQFKKTSKKSNSGKKSISSSTPLTFHAPKEGLFDSSNDVFGSILDLPHKKQRLD